MLSLQSGKGESCVICPSRKRSALHSTVYSLNLRTRARHRLQGVVKALDDVYPGMRMGKLPCWNGTVAGKLRMTPSLLAKKPMTSTQVAMAQSSLCAPAWLG